MKNIYLCLLLIVAIFLCNTTDTLAQFYLQDSSFHSLVKRNEGYVSSFIKLPDNKILVIGGMDYVNYAEKVSPIRLNEDGSLDDSFLFSSSSGKSSVALRRDGKMIVNDLVSGTDGEPHIRLSLYKSNGQLDSAFLTDIKSSTTFSPKALAVQDDHKIIVGNEILQENYSYKGVINRVKTDGSIDTTFSTKDLNISWISVIAIQRDGKILVSGSFEMEGGFRKNLVRLHTDGSLDSSFNPPLIGFGNVNDITFQQDGKILLGTGGGIIRLLPTGELDDSFTINGSSVRSIALQPDGKILIGCWASDTTISGYGQVIRLNADGSRDASFDAGQGAAEHSIDALVVQSNGQVLAGGYFHEYNGQPAHGIVRLNGTDGKVDPTFSTKFESRGHLEKTVVQPDGKLLIFGVYNTANNQPRNDLARLHQDGSIDDSFQIGTGVDGFWSVNGGSIMSVALQEDHKILVGGFFKSFNSTSANSLLRLNEDGSIDLGFKKFVLDSFSVNAIAVQNDGKIFVGGQKYFGEEAKMLTRLLPDGSIDPDFTAGESRGYVSQILIQEDGKILVSGGFSSYNNVLANHIIRLNSDGTVDETFQATGADTPIKKMMLQEDGKILVLGSFTKFNNVLVNNLVRLKANGTVDEAFNHELGINPQLHDFVLQPDGQILVSGYLFQGSKKLVLLRSDGSLNDELFVLEFNHNSYFSMTKVGNKLFIITGNNLIQLYTLQQQSITFDAIPDKFVGDPPFTLNATASSGLPVTFKIVSGPATVEGNVVTLTGQPGLVTIQALQEGNLKFEMAEVKEQSFMVEQALGIENTIQELVKIYPNPASEYILIESPFILDRNTVICLYNMKGQNVPISLNTITNGYRIELQQLSRGIYLLQLLIGNEKLNQKVVLE